MNKRVFIMLHTLSTGGAERHASSIANYLADHGYRVTIVLLDNSINVYHHSLGVEIVSLTELSYPEDIEKAKPGLKDSALLKLYKISSQKKYQYIEKTLYLQMHYVKKLEYYLSQQNDLENSTVISFMPYPNLCASMVKEKLKFKLILGEFNSPHLEFAPDAPENRLKERYFPNADGFVFQTEEQQSFYSYLPNVKKAIIPNPIEEIETKPYQGIRKKEIVNFCRLSPVKNIPLLVEAFAMLSKDYSDYSLVIYGEGWHKETIEKSISKHGVEDNVFIKPFANNVLDLTRDSAMFVSSSDREGISNSMIEAMAIGLPVVCTDCPAGGARMMIKPYENGLLVPVNDPDALYHAMKYIIEHPNEASKMGKNAVAIRERLEKGKILNKWLSFIESI